MERKVMDAVRERSLKGKKGHEKLRDRKESKNHSRPIQAKGGGLRRTPGKGGLLLGREKNCHNHNKQKFRYAERSGGDAVGVRSPNLGRRGTDGKTTLETSGHSRATPRTQKGVDESQLQLENPHFWGGGENQGGESKGGGGGEIFGLHLWGGPKCNVGKMGGLP